MTDTPPQPPSGEPGGSAAVRARSADAAKAAPGDGSRDTAPAAGGGASGRLPGAPGGAPEGDPRAGGAEPAPGPPTFWQAMHWLWERWTLFLVNGAVIAGLAALHAHDLTAYALLGSAALLATVLVTQPVATERGRNARSANADPRVRAVLQVGYYFAALIILGCVYVLQRQDAMVWPPEPLSAPGGPERIYPVVALLPGCDYARAASRPAQDGDAGDAAAETVDARIPEGVLCGDLPPQWVISIGGSVLRCHLDQTCFGRTARGAGDAPPARAPGAERGTTPRDAAPQGAPAGGSAAPAGAGQVSADGTGTSPGAGPDAAAGACARERPYACLSAAELEAERERLLAERRRADGAAARHAVSIRGNKLVEQAGGAVKPTTGSLAKALEDEQRNAREATRALAAVDAEIARREEQQSARANTPGHPVIGGVVVPVYFVVLALFGALVQMLRRLPEFQARADVGYAEEYERDFGLDDSARPPIPASMVPEYVVFQMIQVLVAPAIAVLAYAWAPAEEPAVAMVLAFGAGFSSELVLLAIRGVIDRALGAGPRPGRRALRGVAKRLDSLEQREDAAEPIVLDGVRIRPGDEVRLKQTIGIFEPGTTATVVRLTPPDSLTVHLPGTDGVEEQTRPAAQFFEPAPRRSSYVRIYDPPPVG